LFVVGETITGASSSATGVVNAYVRQSRSVSHSTVSGKSHAGLAKGSNSTDTAQDFKPGIYISKGSWVSLSILEANGASNITVQLELEAL
jgi:hypothetical protein